MSCLAEPPTTPDEIVSLGEELARYHAENADSTTRAGYCVDIAHGHIDADGALLFDNVALFRATLPYLHHVHLKNTDARFDATFGFTAAERQREICQVKTFRDLLLANADRLPVTEVVGYLEVAGPKLGRDYSNCMLERGCSANRCAACGRLSGSHKDALAPLMSAGRARNAPPRHISPIIHKVFSPSHKQLQDLTRKYKAAIL
jgi:hypothetical protein